jgi:hypothetical protein
MKHNYRIFLIVPLLVFSTTFFHINGFFTFGDNYHTFLIVSNHIWDETTHYLLTPIRFIEFGDLSFQSSPSSKETLYFLKDFFSTLQNIIFYFIFDLKYIGLVLDIFSVLANLLLFYFLFKKIFDYDNFISFVFSVISIIFFGYGPQTYNEIIGFFTFNPYTEIPTITRHEPTANTNIGFLISLIGLYYFYYKENYKLFFITSLIAFFSYIYVSLFYVVLCGIVLFFKTIYLKKSYLIFFKNILIPLTLFILWSSLMLYMDSQGNLRNTQHISDGLSIKFLIINIVYILLNLANIKYTKNLIIKKNSIIIIFVFVSCGICFYSTLFTGIDLGGNEHFYYYANPFQWITFFNLLYNFKSKINNNIYVSIITLLIIIQLIGVKNYSDKYFFLNKQKIINQVKYVNDLDKLKKNTAKKTIISLDPLYVWYGFNLTNSYSFIPSHLDLSVSSDEILNKFLITSKIFNLSTDELINYFFKKPNISSRSINFEEITFAGDINDNIYDALSIKGLKKTDLINYIKRKYNQIEVSNIKHPILISKNWHIPNKKIYRNKKITYENETFILLESVEY